MLLLSICFQVTFSILTLKFVMLIGAKNKFIRQKKKAVFFKQEETTQSNYSVMNVATTARQLATVLFRSFFLYCSCRKQSENLLHGANTERVWPLDCVWVHVCMCSESLLSSGVQGVPGSSVGVLPSLSFHSLLTSQRNILFFSLFTFLIRAPHSLTVLFHFLSIPIANQLEEFLVPQPGVGAWCQGWCQRFGADAGAWWGTHGRVTQSRCFCPISIIDHVDCWFHLLSSEHM